MNSFYFQLYLHQNRMSLQTARQTQTFSLIAGNERDLRLVPCPPSSGSSACSRRDPIKEQT